MVDADSVSASASISWENRSTSWEYPIDSGDGKALKANWDLAGNTGISASYQWYKKVGWEYSGGNFSQNKTVTLNANAT